MTVSFKQFTGKSKVTYSPRAGLLILSRVYRSFDIADQFERAMGMQNCKDGEVAESLLILQAAGADCVQDLDLLSETTDTCLSQGLGHGPPTKPAARSFLETLGHPEQSRGFQRLLNLTRAGLNKALVADDRSLPKQVTIDVREMAPQSGSALSWPTVSGGEFPRRIFCVWHEADLILSGELCHDEKMVRRCIARALGAVQSRSGGRLIRAGTICFQPSIIEWLSNRLFKIRDRRFPVSFIISHQVDLPLARKLDGKAAGWAHDQIQDEYPFEWIKLGKGTVGRAKVSRIALRRRENSNNPGDFRYAALIGNCEREAGHEVNRFLRGERELTRIQFDLEHLARGSNPSVLSDLTGEGRFRLAMLNYNLCTAISRIAFKGSDHSLPINRLRELVFHTSGSLVKGAGSISLKLMQDEAKRVQGLAGKFFAVDEKSSTRRSIRKEPRRTKQPEVP